MHVVERQTGQDFDPLPALVGQGFRHCVQLVINHAVEQDRVLYPAAGIGAEEVAQDRATGRLIGFQGYKYGAAIISGDSAFSEEITNITRASLPGVEVLYGLPHLQLAVMVTGN